VPIKQLQAAAEAKARRAAERYLYQCVGGGKGGVGLRVSPAFNAHGGRGPQLGDIVEAVGESVLPFQLTSSLVGL
jgi:hypothetical protein